MNSSEKTSTHKSHVPLGKRLLAIVYDVLIAFLITIITIVVIQLILGAGKEIPAGHPVNYVLKLFWGLIPFFYFAYYWTERGQTPGMRVWSIKVVSNTNHGALITWKQAIYRYLFAIFGFGLIAIFFDKNNLALQDRMSQSHLIKFRYRGIKVLD